MDSKAPESYFHALEVVSATYIGEGTEVKKPHFSKAAEMAAKVMLENNYQTQVTLPLNYIYNIESPLEQRENEPESAFTHK